MTLLQKALLRACRHSYRFSSCTYFTADNDGIRIPVARGIGRAILEKPGEPFDDVIRFIYGQFRGTFVDVGANIGRVMLSLVRFDRSIPYIAFEPLVRAADYIRDLIDENELSATHSVLPIALLDRVSVQDLRFNSPADVSATISSTIRPEGMYRRRVSIVTAPGDMLLNELGQIGAIKIDAEGVEPLVLRGLRNTIQRTRPAIVLELLPFAHLESGNYNREYFGEIAAEDRERLVKSRRENIASIQQFLEREMDYGFFRLREGVAVAADPWSTALKDQDFLVLPKERMDNISLVRHTD